MLRIGIEVECINASDDLENNMSRYINWSTKGDESLHCDDGVEIYNNGPKPYELLPSLAQDLEEILRDNHLAYTENGEVINSNDHLDTDYDFSCGLHIHFEFPADATISNLIIRECHKSQTEINDLAWRFNEEWGGGVENHLDNFVNGRHTQSRYQGVNISNIGNHPKHTIEFRYASSGIAYKKEDFLAYVHFLKEIWDRTMTIKAPKVTHLTYNSKVYHFQEVNDNSVYVKNGNDIKYLSKFI